MTHRRLRLAGRGEHTIEWEAASARGWGRRSLHEAAGVGIAGAVGAAIATSGVAVWFVRLGRRAGVVSAWDSGAFLSFAAAEATRHVLAHAAIGLAIGAAMRILAGRPRSPTHWIVAQLAAWTLLGGACAVASPASWRLVPIARDLPAGFILLGCALLAALLCRLSRARWWGVALAIAPFAAVVLWPPSRVALPPSVPAPRPHVVILGVDALGREAMDSVVAGVMRDRPQALAGGTYYRNAIAQEPVTRLVWLSLLTGTDPKRVGESQYLGTLPAGATEDRFSTAVPAVLRSEGYRTVFASDVPETSYFSDRWFDERIGDVYGWKYSVRASLESGLPLPGLLVQRFHGTPRASTHGRVSPAALWRAAFGQLRDGRPTFVASHSGVLHAPLYISAWEQPELMSALSIRPSAFVAMWSAAPGPPARHDDRGRPSQADIFRTRLVHTRHDVETLLGELDRKGYRRDAAIVVFGDHGEVFEPVGPAGEVTPGVHGFSLDPATIRVGVLVLPPAPGPAPLRIDSTSLLSLSDIGALLHLVPSRSASAPRGVLPLFAAAAVRPARPGIAGSAHAAGIPPAALARALRLLPEGSMVIPETTRAVMDRASQRGLTDGRVIVSAVPQGDEDMVVRCTDVARVVGSRRLPRAAVTDSLLQATLHRVVLGGPC